MARMRILRSPAAYWFSTGCVLVMHAMLCYPAAVCRGYPPIKPDEIISLLLAPIGMLFPPFFDDAHQDSDVRLRRSASVAVGFSVVWGVVAANLNSARPHVGHLIGVMGILLTRFLFVIPAAVIYFLPSVVFFICLDGLGIGLWSLIRQFREAVQFTNDPSGH